MKRKADDKVAQLRMGERAILGHQRHARAMPRRPFANHPRDVVSGLHALYPRRSPSAVRLFRFQRRA